MGQGLSRLRALLWLAAAALAAPAAAEPAMWTVRDADTEVTLFGTIHELPADIPWLTPRIVDRFDAADTLVVEVVLPDAPYELVRLIDSLGRGQGQPPVSERVPPEKRAALARAIAESGLPPATLDSMETWLVTLTLGDLATDKAGLSAERGADAVLTARAKAAGKPLVGLETATQQLGYFDALPEADQRALLVATLDDMATMPGDMKRLVALWQAGDVTAIAADFDREMRATPGLQRVLVSDRNRRWADWIAGVMARPGKVFVAVGAGHLAGPDNLPDLLKAKGLTVERVP